MAKILNAGLADDLQGAYDKAILMKPEIFEAIQAKQLEQANKDKQEQEAKAAAQAKSRAVSVTGAPKGSAGVGKSAPKQTVQDEVSAAFDSILGNQRI